MYNREDIRDANGHRVTPQLLAQERNFAEQALAKAAAAEDLLAAEAANERLRENRSRWIGYALATKPLPVYGMPCLRHYPEENRWEWGEVGKIDAERGQFEWWSTRKDSDSFYAYKSLGLIGEEFFVADTEPAIPDSDESYDTCEGADCPRCGENIGLYFEFGVANCAECGFGNDERRIALEWAARLGMESALHNAGAKAAEERVGA